MVTRNSLVLALCAMMGGTLACSDSESDNSTSNTIIYAIQVDPSEIQMNKGDVIDVEVTYVERDTRKTVEYSRVKVVSGDTNCVTVFGKDANSVATDVNGKVIVPVAAVGEDCKTSVLISDIEDNSVSKRVSVNVVPSEIPTPKMTFEPTELLIQPRKTKTAYLFYKNADGTPKTGATVNFKYDESCFESDKSHSAITDDYGMIAMTLMAGGFDAVNCRTILVAADGDVRASMRVEIVPLIDYDFTLVTAIDDPYYDYIHYVAYGISDKSCEDFSSDLKANAESVATNVSKMEGGDRPIVAKDAIEDITRLQKSVLVVAKEAADGDTIAYGCHDINMKNYGEEVRVDLIPVSVIQISEPKDIKGTYNIVTNFDLSGIQSDAHENLVSVAEMNAGDWLWFILTLFDTPEQVLVDFIWENSISRFNEIKMSDGSEAMPRFLTDFLSNDSARPIVNDVLTPMLKNYLNDKTKDENDISWHKIMMDVSPDISDLVTNMQFTGTIQVDETSEDGLSVTAAKQDYTSLQYQWSLAQDILPDGCDDKAYRKPNTCRANMPLKNENNNWDAVMTGEWIGKVSSESSSQDILTIDQHELKFQWASLLYYVVFGQILPNALGYKEDASVQNGSYFKAFLEKLLFIPVVKVYHDEMDKYNSDHQCTCDFSGKCTSYEESQICHPKLTQENLCEQFYEALFYMIYPNASQYASIMGTVASIACDHLERESIKRVADSLEKAQSGKFSVKATENCSLFDEESSQYKKIGKEDEGENICSVHDFYTPESSFLSNRCMWNWTFEQTGETPDQTKKYTGKGLFHAVRQ